MHFLLRKSYTSTMLLVFYAIFHHKGQSIFSKLQPCFPSLGALLMLNYISLYALFINKNLYKYNVINVLCYFYATIVHAPALHAPALRIACYFL